MDVPWDYRYEALSGLPDTFGYVVQASAPSGWTFNSPNPGHVEMNITSAITSYYRRADLGVARATWEFDVICTSKSGTAQQYSCYFHMGDASTGADCVLYPTLVDLRTNGGLTSLASLTIDMVSVFRRIRFVKDGNQYRVWIDGQHLLSGTGTSPADDGFYFGQGSSTPRGRMVIRTMRWTNRGAFDPITSGGQSVQRLGRRRPSALIAPGRS